MIKKVSLLLVPAVLSISLCGSASEPSNLKEAVDSITTGAVFETIDHLASEEFAGRLTGTEGYRLAADWIVSEVKKTGLQPLAEFPDFRQPFPFEMRTASYAHLKLLTEEEGGEDRFFHIFKDWAPLLRSPAGECEAEVVFAGFGIVAPEEDRDDYEGLDVEGKVVLVIRGKPEEGDWKEHAGKEDLVGNARERGAAGILMVGGTILSATGPYPDGTMVAMVNEEAADLLLAGTDLKIDELKRLLRKGGTVGFATGNRVRFIIEATPTMEYRGENVVALLPGSDPTVSDEYVIIGSHLDHVGNSLVLCPGADDNASGSAAVLEVARAASKLDPPPRRSLLFVWFGGEELGLLGARHLAANLPESLGTCLGLYNMDMVGAGSGLWVAAGEDFPELLDPLEQSRDKVYPELTLKAGKHRGGSYADHVPFLEAGIPAVSLFGSGGEHHGYHTDEDTAWWITPKIIAAAARTVLHAAVTVADEDTPAIEGEELAAD